MTKGPDPRPLEDRFWPKVNRGLDTDCWDWQAATDGKGYGRIWDVTAQRAVVAARAVWEMTYGSIPDGLTIDHLCHRSQCVNPAHLRLLTREANGADGAAWKPRKTHCVHGHDVAILGRNKNNTCRACVKMRNDAQPRKTARRVGVSGTHRSTA